MAHKDMKGQVTESPREATQSENSKDSFVVLIVSLAAAVIVGLALFWYFGTLPGTEHAIPAQPG